MELSNINPKDIIFALDIGTRSIIGTAGIVRDKKFYCVAESYIEHEERAMMDGQIHDISLVASGVNTVKSRLEKELGFKLKDVSIAAAGRFLRTAVSRADLKLDFNREIDKNTIRSIELSAVKNAEEHINESTQGKLYCVGYSVKSYYLNDYVISNLLSHKGEKVSAEVIATFLPRSVVESLYAVMDKSDLNVVNLTLEPIAAMEAAVPKSLRLLNLALVDIGAGTSDIAISSKDSISAYGMVATAGDEVTEAIAQNLLVDFNTAERIKKECSVKDTVIYTDVLGLPNEMNSEDIINITKPIVNKICDEVSNRIIELNGGKAPNAVFLVGGGAHTPGLKEILAEKLNLPAQRIAIKGREAVADCVCLDNSLGSIGVTVLGIALISIMKLGQDFINVNLNNSVVSLFNSQRHTVADAMMQAGINPRVLIGKNGRNIRFYLNGVKRVAFGTLASNAEVQINGKEASLDSEVREGDNIEIAFSADGQDAAPKPVDYVERLNVVSFYLDGLIKYIEPVAIINDRQADLEEIIEEGDDVKITFPNTVETYKQFVEKKLNVKYYIDDRELQDSYVIQEEDKVTRKYLDDEIISEQLEYKGIEAEAKSENKTDSIEFEDSEKIKKDTEVLVNGKNVLLKNKEKYIFIDIFDYIDFDLTVAKGNLVLLLNGKKAGYHDVLSAGDEIRIYWE
jgi:cell division protein FtsA